LSEKSAAPGIFIDPGAAKEFEMVQFEGECAA
jgi:hypothetical protein